MDFDLIKADVQNNKMNREWIKYIDLNLLDIYPLQLANCDRLSLNDSVYIFDEVGSGKTISSGLMALDYLYNNIDKNVLIITTNSLYKKGLHSNYGQFLNDWFEKLPFKSLDLESRIVVTNNHYSHFNHLAEYGLVIIDEAQLFLNNESMRYKALTENISAQKVVFLTATPIKNSVADLQVYVEIAKEITQKKEISNDWIKHINTVGKKEEDIICSAFDISSPVTRYFKDTIMSLNIEGYRESPTRRLLPRLWEYGRGETKNKILLENINSKCEENSKNNFVIFTRFVEKEAYEIANYLKDNGFVEHNNNNLHSKTYAVVTGGNAFKLSDYSRSEDLPTVLILTYQIAEQGINLPGYNHVVNYHIPAFPSALEQRFGRIDRMVKNGSKFKKINMCFLIAKDSWDTNTCNFYCAISIYLRNLISYLPSKNTILSDKIIEQYYQKQSLVKEYIEKITNMIEKQIQLIIKYFKELNDPEVDTTSLECECDDDLFTFLEANSIEFNTIIDENEAIELFKKDVKDAFWEMKSYFGFRKDLSLDKYKAIIESVSDKIFYRYSENDISDEELTTLDAIIDCGKYISAKNSFKEYRCKFQENVKFPILVNNYLSEFNQFFEELFIKNEFNLLFPFNGYKEIFEKLISSKFINIDDNDKDIILKNCDKIVKIIPFFKMCKEFDKCLKKMVYTQDRNIRIRFDFNPFIAATWQVGCKIKQDISKMGLSDRFISLYWSEGRNYNDLFKLEHKDGVFQASNWYKLSYHYTRKEEAVFLGDNLDFIDTSMKEPQKNPFYHKEDFIRLVSDAYIDCHEDEDEFYRVLYKYKTAIEDTSKFTELPNKYQSLFNHYIFTDSGKYRTPIHWSFYSCNPYIEVRVCKYDFWTQGINYELWKMTFQCCTWENLLKLPKIYGNIPLY